MVCVCEGGSPYHANYNSTLENVCQAYFRNLQSIFLAC